MRQVQGTQLRYARSLRRLNPLLWGARYAYERADFKVLSGDKVVDYAPASSVDWAKNWGVIL